jgi:hypothetical protein
VAIFRPRSLAAASVALLVASIAFGAPDTWRFIGDERREFASLDRAERDRYPGRAIPLEVEALDFYRRHLRPGDWYYLQVLEGPLGVVDVPTAVGLFARYYLLPAQQVSEPQFANVVLFWRKDVASVPLPYESVVSAPEGQPFHVARLRDR